MNDLIKTTKSYLDSFSLAVDEKYELSWFHKVLSRRLESAFKRVVKGEKVRIIIEVPPRHGKSEMATIKFPSWVLGNNPEIPIIVSSYSADLAQDFGQKTRDIMNNEAYQSVFTTRLREDSKAKGKWMTSKGGGYTATGVGGSITGKGFKIGIIDDPFKNREEADSETIREKVWGWYTSTFYTRQEGVSAIIVIATRWHLDDLIGRLKEKQKEAEAAGLKEYDKWEVIKFSAIAEEDEEYRKAGEPLWPDKFSIAQLENIKNTIGVYDWSSLYQQEPILSENAEFKQEYFRHYKQEDIANLNLKHTTTIDPAVSQKDSADNSVITTIGKDPTKPNWYRREETAGHLDPLQLIDAIFYHYEKYRSEIWIETVAFQKSLKYFIEEEQRKRQIYFTVNELKRNNSTSKEQRVRGLIPLYKTGVIHHLPTDTDYERELLQFPKGRRDDRIDAMASQLEAIENTLENRKKYVQPRYQQNSEFDLEL